jgi:hypothetical protein
MILDIKIMYVSKYDFISKETGENLKGCKITFMNKSENITDNTFGYKIYTVNSDYDTFELLQKKSSGKLPFDCRAEFEVVSLDKAPKFKEFIFN